LTSRIAYGPPIYSDRSTFTDNLVSLALFSIILVPIAFYLYYNVHVDCWRECEELCELEPARCNKSLLSCEASARGVSVKCDKTILAPLLPLIPILVILLVTLRGPIEVLLYENMLVVRGGPLAGGDRIITRHEVTRVTLELTSHVRPVFYIGKPGAYVGGQAVYRVCVESPSNSVCVDYYSSEQAKKLLETIERVWGIRYTLK
jgi:hypothetical protein